MNLSLERKIILGFVTAVVTVLATGVVAWLNGRRVDRTFEWVDHTHRVRYEVENVLVHLLNMQTGARGFVLTGEETFLTPYTHALREIDPAFDRLTTLTADNPSQKRRVDDLRALATEARAAFADVINNRRTQGSAIADPTVFTRSKGTVDQARSLVAELDAVEQKLLTTRTAEAKNAVNFINILIAITVLLAAGTLALMLRFSLRDYRRRLQVEEELADFFRLSLDPLCVISPDGRFLRLNPAWETVLGYPLDQMIGRPFLEFIHPDDVDRSQAEAKRIGTGGEAIAFQNRYRARDGTWHWLEWNAAASPSSGQLIAVARDVTSRKADEERIAQLNENLQTQNVELEAFSYSVSHDLRAPLRHMAGFAQLLEKHSGPALDDKGRHYIATIASAAATMGKLIDNLLDFSRTARAPLHPQPVDHKALVEDVVRTTRLPADTPIDWHIGPLPVLPGDPALLRQVWTNYLSNAAKYSAKAQPRPIVEVNARTAANGREVEFTVKDNGVGFDPRYAARLFQVFSRLHDEQQFEGTGIGLALVRRIVARHGGRTWAESQPDRGASFHFSLPLHPPATPAPAAI